MAGTISTTTLNTTKSEPHSPMITIDTDVLIVGAGPAGLTACNLLTRAGVRCLTISKHPHTANSPRAHITNQRAMEVMRDLGIESLITPLAMPQQLMKNNVWATSFAGAEFARLDAWGAGEERIDDYKNASPSSMCNISQHTLEPILLNHARQQGAQVLFMHELIQLTANDDYQLAIIKDRQNNKQLAVRANYVIGADGANSKVMSELKIDIDGRMGLAHVANCWLDADLHDYVAERPGVLYWLSAPDRDAGFLSATFVAVKPWDDWVMVFNWNKEEELENEALLHRARTLIGDPHVAVRIKSLSKWQVNQATAQTMRQGNIFLVGDAAHRHPPPNGLGSNTGIQDSFNLCWKLIFVLQGKASAKLLESYNQERMPVAKQIVSRAMRSAQTVQATNMALGIFSPKPYAAMCKNFEELNEKSELGRRRQESLNKALQMQQYQFNCHGVEMGQFYESSAVFNETNEKIQYVLDPELYYQPSGIPGSVVPHAWIKENQISTLDCCGKGEFSLLIAGRTHAWDIAISAIESTLKLPLNASQIESETWQKLCGLNPGGALLVRPDRHIAWRSVDIPVEPVTSLLRVFQSIL